MFSKMTTGFRKNEDCPSSEELLAYESGELARATELAVGEHLTVCEFCEAEVEFYSRFPQGDVLSESPVSADIPAPLFQLAEALLKRHDSDAKSLNTLLRK
jgi:anti-sigma factor ChrR (cupin superfamily)